MAKRISALLGVFAIALLAIACAQTDAGITNKVKSKLAADETLKNFEIMVDTKEKVVTLSGTVDNQTAKDQAVNLARGTEGVAEVVDNITLSGGAATTMMGGEAGALAGTEPPMGAMMDDAGITAAVKGKLAADATTGGFTINVETQMGIVTLTGSVRSQAEKDQAIKLAQETSGVKSIEDKLTIEQK